MSRGGAPGFWSSAAQPAGNFDTFVEKFGLSVEAEVTAVENTQADWVFDQVGADRKKPIYAGRPPSAATAVGQMSKHVAQLKALLGDALG